MLDEDILAEFCERETVRERARAESFPDQWAFVSAEDRLGSVLCTRRAGKSMGAALKLILCAVLNPKSLSLFLTITRVRAKDILWDVLKEWVGKLEIAGVEWNETELKATFPNGSSIKLAGADADSRQKEKVLGLPYTIVIIDECASFQTSLRKLIQSSLRPAMVDKRGAIWLIGTPGDFIGSKEEPQYFYAITTGHDRLSKGWSPTLAWSAYDNPHVAEQWAEDVAAIERDQPLFKETPIYKQMWLGQWAIDDTKLVYRYSDGRNAVALDAVPKGVRGQVIGIDLGYNDDTAFSIGGWKPGDRRLYVLSAYKQKAMIFSDVASHLHWLLECYPDAQLVIDGANRQGVEEMRRRHNLSLESAEKSGKADYIRTMNSDMIMGQILYIDGACAEVVEEYSALVWDDRASIRKEKASCANHCFVAGTMIRTVDGEVAIENLQPGDMVMTRQGPRPIDMTGPTGHEPIWELETMAGTIRGTGGHRIWTENRGWIELWDLTPSDMLRAWPEQSTSAPESMAPASRSSSTACATGAIRSRPIDRCACTTSRSAERRCIERFGNSTTVASFHATSTSTTWTATRSATTSATSLSSTAPSTYGTTPASPSASPFRAGPLRSRGERHQHGTPPSRGWRGIASTCLTLSPTVRFALACAVASATCVSLRTTRASASVATSAPRVGTRESAANLASIARPGHAPSAGASSAPTSTTSPAAVPCRALRRSRTGIVATVYNLAVREVHEYFANGVLVANCADATLYMWRHARAFLEEAEGPGTPAPWSEQYVTDMWKRRGQEQRDEDTSD